MKKSTLLTKIKALSRPEAVTIEGIDEPLYIRRISVAEQNEFVKLTEKDSTAAAIALVLFGVGDESGARVFSDDDAAEIEQLDSKTVGHIVNAITRVNFDKTVDELEKNS